MSRHPAGWSDHQGDHGRGRDRPRRHRQGGRRPACLLRPHARPARPSTACSTSRSRPRATCTSTPTTPSRTPRSRSAGAPQALGDKVGICRFGDAAVPLDEALAQVTVDLSGRPYLVHTEPDGMAPMIGTYDTTMTRHILESFVARRRSRCTWPSPAATRTTSWRPVQGAGQGPALRAARADPGRAGHPQHEGRAMTPAAPGRGAGLRLGQIARRSGRCDGPAPTSRSPPTANRAGRRRPGGARRRRLRRLHGRAARGARRQIIGRRLAGGRPVLGICVGMQILFDDGVEHGVETEGCGEWPGTVERLHAPVVPHMGWNTVDAAGRTAAVRRASTRRALLLRALLRRARPGPCATSQRSRRRWSPGPSTGTVRRRRGERSAVGHPVPPREVRRRRSRAAGQLAGDAAMTTSGGPAKTRRARFRGQAAELLPAVDVADGQAVRLVQGEAGTETPTATRWAALAWQRRRRVAASGRPGRRVRPRRQPRAARRGSAGWTSRSSCPAVSATTPRWRPRWPPAAPGSTSAPPRWRTRSGSGAIAEHGDRIAVGLDVRGTTLAARGWTRDGGELYETLDRLDAEGCARYVVTDITKDGTLTGPEPGPAAERLRRDRPAGGRQRRRLQPGRPAGAGRAGAATESRARSSARRCTPGRSPWRRRSGRWRHDAPGLQPAPSGSRWSATAARWRPGTTCSWPGAPRSQARSSCTRRPVRADRAGAANVAAALDQLGLGLADVVRTRILVTDIPAGRRRPGPPGRVRGHDARRDHDRDRRAGGPAGCWSRWRRSRPPGIGPMPQRGHRGRHDGGGAGHSLPGRGRRPGGQGRQLPRPARRRRPGRAGRRLRRRGRRRADVPRHHRVQRRPRDHVRRGRAGPPSRCSSR